MVKSVAPMPSDVVPAPKAAVGNTAAPTWPGTEQGAPLKRTSAGRSAQGRRPRGLDPGEAGTPRPSPEDGSLRTLLEQAGYRRRGMKPVDD